MAIDEWLLDQAVSTLQPPERQPPVAGWPDGSRTAANVPCNGQAGATLRFYRWSRPTLSIGFHQRRLPEHWLALQGQGVIDLVRRPSGGRAVLHTDELTYALIWPSAPTGRRQAYRFACSWLQQGFHRLGLPLRFGTEAPASGDSCFASGSAADLVHDDGAKRIGNAQLWRRGVLLQHGSILLNPDPELWQMVLQEAPPRLTPLASQAAELIRVLSQAARTCLPLLDERQQQPLTPQDWQAIGARLERYRVPPLVEQEPCG